MKVNTTGFQKIPEWEAFSHQPRGWRLAGKWIIDCHNQKRCKMGAIPQAIASELHRGIAILVRN
ncbi:hypothetical protein B9S53_11695 [Arthrospira sp. O9.13F]|nr:hypothetical protein B9S53_14470 [Arthrospira sp. O9.13F]RAQ43106.1 hypothetical protein B9S53_11695 [Arthrospira sp. O9.13F]